MRAVCEHIAQKAVMKYRTINEALRYVDADHDGKVDQSEMRYFFRAYDFTPNVADRFFDYLRGSRPEIPYLEFVRYMTEFIDMCGKSNVSAPSKFNPAFATPRASPKVAPFASAVSTPRGAASTAPWTASGGVPGSRAQSGSQGLHCTDAALEAECRGYLKLIGCKATAKFGDARRALSFVDGNMDGTIHKEQIRYFFRAFNLESDAADHFFRWLDTECAGEVDYAIFETAVMPYIMPDKDSGRSTRRPVAPESGRTPRLKATHQSLAVELAKLVNTPGKARPRVEEVGSDPPNLGKVLKRIGEKLPIKFRHNRDAFRALDLNRNGRICRTEMRSFFGGFGENEDVADYVFDLLQDSDDCHGEVPFGLFMSHFDSVLGKAFRQAQRAPLINVENPEIEKEVNDLAAMIGVRLTTKYKTLRDAFRAVDCDHDGNVSQVEMRQFFRSFGMSCDSADKFFEGLDGERQGWVSYDKFMAMFGEPHAKVAGRSGSQKAEGH